MRKGWITAAGIALAVVLFLGGCSGQPLSDREMGTGGGALLGGVGGIQLGNEKGVVIELRGPKAGMEFAANLSEITISLK